MPKEWLPLGGRADGGGGSSLREGTSGLVLKTAQVHRGPRAGRAPERAA